MLNLDDYYSGGFFLIRSGKPEWEQLRTDLLPPKLVSLSLCMCDHVCVYWGWTPGNIPAALKFGIPQSLMDEFVEWCGKAHHGDIDHPSMFFSVDAARRFIERFLPDTSGLYLIEAGLHHTMDLLNIMRQTQVQVGEFGIEERLQKRLPLALGGLVLDYDVGCFGFNDFWDSWLCSPSIHVEMHQLFGIRPNSYGLFETYEDAVKVYAWIEDGNRPEPAPYFPWLLVSHPLL